MTEKPPRVKRRSAPVADLHFRPLWQSIGWVMVGIVIWLSLTPHPPQPPSFIAWDKAQHFGVYAALMYWFRQAFGAGAQWPAFLLALGIALEILQGTTGARTADVIDGVANGLGVGAGMLLGISPLGGVLSAADAQLAALRR